MITCMPRIMCVLLFLISNECTASKIASPVHFRQRRSLPSTLFAILESSSCAAESGHALVRSRSTCFKGVNAVGWSGKKVPAYPIAYPHIPPGCSAQTNGAVPALRPPTGGGACSSSYKCLCYTGPVCEHDTGTQANPSACMCGTTLCEATSDEISIITYGSWSVSPFQSIWSKKEMFKSGLYCVASLNNCYSSPVLACSESTGLVANTGPCVCGNIGMTCDASNGLFCISNANTCSKNRRLVAEIQVGSCEVLGYFPIKDQEDCRAAGVIASWHLFTGAAQLMIVSLTTDPRISGCFTWPSSGPFIAVKYRATGSDASCDGIGTSCMCFTGPACTHTDMTNVNPSECMCGTKICNRKTGLVCVLSSNKCISITKLFWGKCEDNPNRHTINDIDECATAYTATLLGAETDQLPNQISNNPGRPKGCLKQASTLFFNIADSPAACDVDGGYSFASAGGYCMCWNGPACTSVQGISPNDSTCMCGTKICNTVTGLHCQSSISTCSPTNPCFVNVSNT